MVVRGGKYKPGDFYLSLDLTLAGLAAVIAYAADLKRRQHDKVIGQVVYDRQYDFMILWGGIGVVLVVFLVLFHQWGETPEGKVAQQKTNYWLVGPSNAFGILYMFVFLYNIWKPW
jgi:hypothetical protein